MASNSQERSSFGLKGGFKVSSDMVSLGLNNGLKVSGMTFLGFRKGVSKCPVTRFLLV